MVGLKVRAHQWWTVGQKSTAMHRGTVTFTFLACIALATLDGALLALQLRWPTQVERGLATQPPNLAGLHLRSTDLWAFGRSEANLEGANLRGAQVPPVRLVGANRRRPRGSS